MDLYVFLVATSSLTGVVGLSFEASGQLQTPFMGKTMVKEREMATYLHKTTLL